MSRSGLCMLGKATVTVSVVTLCFWTPCRISPAKVLVSLWLATVMQLLTLLK